MVLINFLVMCCVNILVNLIYLHGVSGSTVLDFFTHRLDTGGRSTNDNDFPVIKFQKRDSPAMKLIEKHGYPAESHEIKSEDGYLLTMYRIPKPGKPPVLLCHGIMASSDVWLQRGPENDLAFLLYDNGYDVWLTNFRGNVYSRKHVSLDPDRDEKFWDFSFHEMGYYDMPAMIDHVLNVTEQKSVIYIGHSMGTTVFFVLCSTRPEYNSKIRLFHGMGPAVFMIHQHSPLINLIVANVPSIVESCKQQNIYELFPLKKITGRLGRALCYKSAPTQPLCLAGIYLFSGVDYQQMNMSILPTVFEHYPAGASLNTFLHFYQSVLSGGFRHMDYGETENLIRYKRKDPPDYNLKKVTVPIALYYGDGDSLVNGEDSEVLANSLSNLIGVFRVPFPFFNHIDFLFGMDTKKLLYDQVLLITNKYR